MLRLRSIVVPAMLLALAPVAMAGAPRPTVRLIDPRPQAPPSDKQGPSAIPVGAGPVWTEVGPEYQPGRTHTAALSTDGFTLFVGSDQAGGWSGNPFYDSYWSPFGDELGHGAQRLAVAFIPPPATKRGVIRTAAGPGGDRMVACPRQDISSYLSYHRFHYSDDGGLGWNPVGISSLISITRCKRLVRDGLYANIVYALVEGGDFFDFGWWVLRSYDAGASFEPVRFDNSGYEPDLFVRRDGVEAKIYVVEGEFGDIQSSIDEGFNWNYEGTVYPVNGTGTWLLSASEAGAPRLYALTNGSLYLSDDAGATWSYVSDPPHVDVLCGSIWNLDLVLCGDALEFGAAYSYDGGLNFTDFPMDWASDRNQLHPATTDIQCLLPAYFPAQTPSPAGRSRAAPAGVSVAEQFYIHTGGGTYVWYDGAPATQILTWSGIHNGEFSGVVTRRRGLEPWAMELSGNDLGVLYVYGCCLPAPAGPHIVATGGNHFGFLGSNISLRPDDPYIWSYINWGGIVIAGPGEFGLTGEPSDPVALSGEYAFTMVDPADPFSIFFGGGQLHRITYDPALDTFSDATIGPLFSSDFFERVAGLGISPADPDFWYLCTSYGNLFTSTDGGVNWTVSGNIVLGPADYASTVKIAVTPSMTDRLVCTVAGDGFGGAMVYRTTDGGSSWNPLDAGLPPGARVWDMDYDNNWVEQLYAATTAGPFVYDSFGGFWVDLAPAYAGVPDVEFREVEPLPDRAVMRFTTWGRGVWDYFTALVAGVADGRQPPSPLRVAALQNPMRGSGRLAFTLPGPAATRLELFDAAGRRAGVRLTDTLPAGRYEVSLGDITSGSAPLRAGVYFARLSAGGSTATHKFIIEP